MLRAAIVGLGWWGQVLVRSAHNKSKRLRFVRGITRTPLKVKAFADETQIPIESDYLATLADSDIDAVVLATPHSQHVEQIVAAAAAGKHVFCEKPLTLTARDACIVFDACEKAGVVLAVGQNRRFLPSFHYLKGILESGLIGSPMHVDGNYSGPAGYRRAHGSWRNDATESPSGGMTGRGLHLTDLMIALFGCIEEVDARSYRQVLTGEVDDTTTATLQFKTGMTGSLRTIIATADIWQFQILGSKGWAEMQGYQRVSLKLIDGEESIKDFPHIDIELAELEAFVDAVEGKQTFPVTRQEALCNIAVLEAVGLSAAQKRRVGTSEFTG